MTGEDPILAGEEAVDPERLLPGEDPATRHVDDAETWLAVYSELAAFKRDLVSSTESRAAGMLPAAAKEVRATDLPILRAEAQRLSAHYAFWKRRVDTLTAH